MENRFFKNNNSLDKNETRSNVVQFPNIIASNGNMIDDDDNEKIIIYVPKGYAAKVILEKKYESGTTIEYQEPSVNANKINSEIFTNNIKDELAMTSVCDIMNLQTGTDYIRNFTNRDNISKEEVDMKLNKTKELDKVHIEFLTVSFITIILSLIGLLVFSISGFYIIHPSIYILGFFMGLGWLATATTSIYKHRR